MSSDDDVSFDGNMFEEPEDYVGNLPDHHFVSYDRKFAGKEFENGVDKVSLRLVGKSPLWGHLLWNAGIYTANYLEQHNELIKGKTVVEFGAASALPSILCGFNKAKCVVSTDYPDPILIDNIKFNIEDNCQSVSGDVHTAGFIWGNEIAEIQDLMHDDHADLIIMSDLVFNHSEHRKLLKSAKQLIRPGKDRQGGKCLVVWSPHRPKKEMVENDFNFFTIAKDEFDFDVEFVEMVHWEHPMFPEDPKETEELRKRVYCYILHPTW